MNILFLDIDGVVNHNATPSHRPPTADEPLPIPVAPECMAWLNYLIRVTSAHVVISSSWRMFARWQDLGPALNRHGLVGNVIGETPDLVNCPGWLERWRSRNGAPFAYERMERGWEIREWIAAHPEVTRFVILDDCSDMAELKLWHVLTDPDVGLDEPDVERAMWLMARSWPGVELARRMSIGYV